MRNPFPEEVELGRMPLLGSRFASLPGDRHGAFQIDALRIITSPACKASDWWEHVSVSLEDRIPTWVEMCRVKDLFWMETECVVQFHPPKSDYVNIHPNVLHLWRPTRMRDRIRLPPKGLV